MQHTAARLDAHTIHPPICCPFIHTHLALTRQTHAHLTRTHAHLTHTHAHGAGTYAYVTAGHVGKAVLTEGEGSLSVESWQVGLALGATVLALGFVGRLAKQAVQEADQEVLQEQQHKAGSAAAATQQRQQQQADSSSSSHTEQ